MEDAAVLRPQSGAPFVFTVDFITPVVDDAETFGAIAAANSLSDVYAMGGDPQVALAVCGAPEDLPQEVLVRIFQGGRDKAAEAGCAIVGGHTVLDPELKYGLCVVGTLPPGRSLAQSGARAGDRLVLSKPIGCGIAAQAIKRGCLPAAGIEAAVRCMTLLNRGAGDAAPPRAPRQPPTSRASRRWATFTTCCSAPGRGPAAGGGGPGLRLARELAAAGPVPAGTRKNLQHVAAHRLRGGPLGPGPPRPLRSPDLGRAAHRRARRERSEAGSSSPGTGRPRLRSSARSSRRRRARSRSPEGGHARCAQGRAPGPSCSRRPGTEREPSGRG
jgi:selenide,water dikinase